MIGKTADMAKSMPFSNLGQERTQAMVNLEICVTPGATSHP